MFWIGIFIFSLFVLVYASHHFVAAAERVGQLLHVPPFFIGVTILAIGTSLPELVTSIVAVLQGASEIVVANVIGSNVANIFLILGATTVFAGTITVGRKLFAVDLALLVGVTFLLIATIWDGMLSRGEAVLYIAGLVLYVFYSLQLERTEEYHRVIGREVRKSFFDRDTMQIIGILIVSPIFIFGGAYYTVQSALEIAQAFAIGTEIIAISAIALGTSLPELVVSLIAVKKGNADMAVGNVLGSNIFNTLAVVGIPGLIAPLVVAQNMVVFGLAILFIATLMYFFVARENRITKWEGWLLLLFYVVFLSQITAVIG